MQLNGLAQMCTHYSWPGHTFEDEGFVASEAAGCLVYIGEASVDEGRTRRPWNTVRLAALVVAATLQLGHRPG